MSGFDRIKPPELVTRPERPDGRSVLFAPPPTDAPALPPLSVTCSRCAATSPLDGATAVRSALPLVLVAPWRTHPVFARCPSCARRSWLRVVPTPRGDAGE